VVNTNIDRYPPLCSYTQPNVPVNVQSLQTGREMSLPYQDLEALDTGSSSSASGGIILGSSDQWRTWYSTIKVTAKRLGVWKYLDPDASNPEKIPEEPRETQPGMPVM
jgi:hypothetical protein